MKPISKKNEIILAIINKSKLSPGVTGNGFMITVSIVKSGPKTCFASTLIKNILKTKSINNIFLILIIYILSIL